MADATSVKKYDNHVVVLAFPFASHPGILLDLIRRLANAAPNVKFSFLTTAKSNASLSSSRPTPENNIKAYNVADGLPEGYTSAGGPEEEIGLFLKAAQENFRKGIETAQKDTGKRVSHVVADALLWFSADLADEMSGVSWVPVWTSAACSLSVHVYTDLIRQTFGLEDIDGREDEVINFIPGFPEAVRVGDLPTGVVHGDLESPFSIMLHKMGRILLKANAIATNTFQELEPTVVDNLKSRFNKVLNVGPFTLTSPPVPSSSPPSNSDKYNCIAWLNKQKESSVAYIGFGTKAMLPPNEIKAIAEALEENQTPFLWSLGEDSRPHLPEGFLERTNGQGKVVPWAPQVRVLEHSSTGVFINHSGWNSVLESISTGLPIICRPIFGDHVLNAWMVEKVWQIGVRIEGRIFTKDATIRALRLVLEREEGKRLKQQGEKFKKLALDSVGPNGSSTQDFETLVELISTNN